MGERFRATFLFATPGWIEGAARLFDFAGSMSEYNTTEPPGDADARALAQDWLAVGDYLREALGTVPKRTTDRRLPRRPARALAGLPEPHRQLPSQRGLSGQAAFAEVEAFASRPEGPLPPPEHLALYEKILPGSADRILAMAERQQSNRIDLEKTVVSRRTGHASTASSNR